MSSSQPIALPSSSTSHHHPQFHHQHNHSFSNSNIPTNPANSIGGAQGMDYGSYYGRDTIMSSGSYTGSSNGDDFNPASYAKHYMGSPLSWRPGSFGGRHVGGSAFYAGSPTAHLLSSFDPNDLRSSKISAMDCDDRNSLLNAVNLFAESEREGELCRDYSCCGQRLPDLHALLDHFEEVHIVVVDANGTPVASNTNQLPNGVDGGAMRVTVSVPFNPQCNNPPISATSNASSSQHVSSSTTAIPHIPLQPNSRSQPPRPPTSSPYGSEYISRNQQAQSNGNQQVNSQYGVPIDPDDMEMEMEESLTYPSNGYDGFSNGHAYGSLSPPPTAGSIPVGTQGATNSPSPPSSNSPSSMSGHTMPSPSSGVPTPPDTPVTTPLSAYPSPRMGTFPANLTPGKRALQHHGSHQSIGHRSLHHKISLQHIHQERLQQGHRIIDGRGLSDAKGAYASAPPSPHPGHVRNSWSHLHAMRGSPSNSLNGALGDDSNGGPSDLNSSSAIDASLVQSSAAGQAAGGSTTFPLNIDPESSSFGHDGFSHDDNAGNFGSDQVASVGSPSTFDLENLGIGSPDMPSNQLMGGSMPGSPNAPQSLTNSPGLTRHASLSSLGFNGANSNHNWGSGTSPALSLGNLSGLDSGFGHIHSEPTSPYVQQSGSAFTMGYGGLHRMSSIDGAIMGGLAGMNAMHAVENAPACVPPALLFSPAGTANPTPVGSRSGSPNGVKAKGKGKKGGLPSDKSDGMDVSSTKVNQGIPNGMQNGATSIRPAPSAPGSAAAAIQSQSLTSRPTSTMLLSKPFRCPKPNCNKSYKQANGLKYHMTHGSCNFAPPKDIELRDRLLEARRREGAESNPGSTPGSGASTPIPGGAVVPDPLGLGTISELELREVEKEAERRLRPFACGIGDCPRRYKNMNGLRYHYQHSGDHGAMGLALLASGQHRCLARNSDKGDKEREGRRAMASAPGSRSNSRASSMNRGISTPSNAAMSGIGGYGQAFAANGTYVVGAVGGAPVSSPLSQGGFSGQQEYAMHQVQAQAVQMPMSVITPIPQTQPQQQDYSQQMLAQAQVQAHLAYQAQVAELQQGQYQTQQPADEVEYGGMDTSMS
ncbi:hypothetical protein ONZ45_g3820 [Pleurotus djamor]|nr:hypothetical protein ONZ45_g3820 [Pleurotus djamor]